jgi:folate-binding Fe-S cluster repair protein YgfZ
MAQETRQMHALSFNKGCYLGQEIVERVRSRGPCEQAADRAADGGPRRRRQAGDEGDGGGREEGAM